MSSIHLILQGKGGVGKSLISAFVAQYVQSKGGKLVCADTDPVNRTFTKYISLDVAPIEIAEGGTVMQQKFDPLMEIIADTDADFVIDNGSSTFLPLTKYLAENDIFQVMAELGKKVYLHTVLVNGQAKSDTYDGMVELLSKVNKYAKVVIWENEVAGTIEFDGHSVTASKPYKDAEKAGKIAGIVRIVDRTQSDAFISDIKKMTSNSMTLADVMESTEFNFLAKNRLKKVVGEVFVELDRVNW